MGVGGGAEKPSFCADGVGGSGSASASASASAADSSLSSSSHESAITCFLGLGFDLDEDVVDDVGSSDSLVIAFAAWEVVDAIVLCWFDIGIIYSLFLGWDDLCPSWKSSGRSVVGFQEASRAC